MSLYPEECHGRVKLAVRLALVSVKGSLRFNDKVHGHVTCDQIEPWNG